MQCDFASYTYLLAVVQHLGVGGGSPKNAPHNKKNVAKRPLYGENSEKNVFDFPGGGPERLLFPWGCP